MSQSPSNHLYQTSLYAKNSSEVLSDNWVSEMDLHTTQILNFKRPQMMKCSRKFLNNSIAKTQLFMSPQHREPVGRDTG